MLEHFNRIQLIPLNKLRARKYNVRRANRKADIDALATSIAAHALLPSLSIIPNDGLRGACMEIGILGARARMRWHWLLPFVQGAGFSAAVVGILRPPRLTRCAAPDHPHFSKPLPLSFAPNFFRRSYWDIVVPLSRFILAIALTSRSVFTLWHGRHIS
jgi:hypothetical protein